MKATEDTEFHLAMARAYSVTARTYMGVDWETARLFADMAMDAWRKVKWA